MTDPGPEQQPPQPPLTPPPAPMPPPAPAPSGVGAPADLGTRFLARLIDHILLGIVTFVILLPFAIGAGIAGYSGFGFGMDTFVGAIITAAITIGYFALMESNMGQTVGKMVLGIRTEGPMGGKPTFEQALKRNAWYALPIIPILGWLAQLAIVIYIAVTINNSATRTGWHDTFAGGTRVVKAK